MKLFNVKHRISASRAPRSNGLAENLIFKVSQMLKILCTNDREIDNYVPIIEFSLRATAHTKIGLTPFEICFGSRMNVGTSVDTNQIIPFTGEYEKYVKMLRDGLNHLHEKVWQQKEKVKKKDKEVYDKRHKVMKPKWHIGQQVLIEDRKVRPRSDQVLTRRPYSGPYIICDIIQGDPTIGTAYKLIDMATGKTYRYLLTSDRLKPYTANRTDLSVRIPNSISHNDSSQTTNQSQNHDVSKDVVVKNQFGEVFEPALRILAIRIRQKKQQYLVLFADKSKYWCFDVTDALLEEYRVRQQKIRDRRKLKRAQR